MRGMAASDPFDPPGVMAGTLTHAGSNILIRFLDLMVLR